jgi:hypothetical protein
MMTAVAAGLLSLSFAAPAAAQSHSHSYRRGYYDCLAGRYDEDYDNHAYRAGCRAARREREERGEGEGGPPPEGFGAPPPPGGFGGPPPYGAPPRPGFGPPPPPNVRGMETFRAVAALSASGYQQVGANNLGAAVVAFYFNRATGGCLQVVYTRGRASDVGPASNPSCR